MSIKRMIAAGATALGLTLPLAAPAQAQDPYLGDIIMVGFDFCPRFYAEAAGQILPINQNQPLYSLLGNRYGGDGRTTFALPDLRGRVPVSYGEGIGLPDIALGQMTGTQTNTMTVQTMPAHTHTAFGTLMEPDAEDPQNNSLASFPAQGANIYASGPVDEAMSSAMIGHAGGSQPFNNMAPTTTLRYCIATSGIFPSRN